MARFRFLPDDAIVGVATSVSGTTGGSLALAADRDDELPSWGRMSADAERPRGVLRDDDPFCEPGARCDDREAGVAFLEDERRDDRGMG